MIWIALAILAVLLFGAAAVKNAFLFLAALAIGFITVAALGLGGFFNSVLEAFPFILLGMLAIYYALPSQFRKLIWDPEVDGKNK